MDGIEWITIHNTGNLSPTATAKAHAEYMFSGSGNDKISWHYTCDATEIWQSFEDNSRCWHAGSSAGNSTSIGIEICLNSQQGFPAACRNAAELTANLLKKYGLSIERLIQHYKWTGKDCPQYLRNGKWGVTWQDFVSMVQTHLAPSDTFYQVQIGAYTVKANADAALLQAKKLGFTDAFIQPYGGSAS